MDCYKKVSVLTQVADGFSFSGKRVSAIVRAEVADGVATVYVSAVNFSAVQNGGYFLFISFGNSMRVFDLGFKISSAVFTLPDLPDLEKGFSAGICFVKEDIPALIAYACAEENKKSVSDFKKAVAEKLLSARKKEKFVPPFTFPPPGLPVAPPTQQPPDQVPGRVPNKVNYKGDSPYDDEAVATENYYARNDGFLQKLKIFDSYGGENVQSENGVSDFGSQKKTEKGDALNDGGENETNILHGEKYSKQNPYKTTVEKELNEIFFKFPEEENLARALPESKWAKITYSEDKFYVVGLIKEHGDDKYICYGVPGRYSKDPPNALKGYCSFVPLSVFDLSGEGYWMMFQDAVSGECVKEK